MERQDGGTDAGRAEPGDAANPGWLATPWFRSPLGIGLMAVHVGLTLALVASTTELFSDRFVDPTTVPAGVVPWYVYVFGVLGALGYVFTALTIDFRRETGKVVQYTVRLPAALPLAAGVFLFSDVLLGEEAASGPLVVGLAFLAGLYVNLAYRRLGALATRLLPGSPGGEDGKTALAASDEPEPPDAGDDEVPAVRR